LRFNRNYFSIRCFTIRCFTIRCFTIRYRLNFIWAKCWTTSSFTIVFRYWTPSTDIIFNSTPSWPWSSFWTTTIWIITFSCYYYWNWYNLILFTIFSIASYIIRWNRAISSRACKTIIGSSRTPTRIPITIWAPWRP